MSITVIKPPACKYCEYWEPYNENNNEGECNLARGRMSVDVNPAGFEAYAPWSETVPSLGTGPDFYCCHFKQKEGE